MIFTSDAYVRKTIFKREEDSHKGDYGKILIFAGSPGMAGAAVLCGRAAIRSGAGLVQYLLPSFNDPIYPILQISVPEATCIEEEYADYFSYSAIVIGPGLGKDKQRLSIMHRIINKYNGILVLDADALNAISRDHVLADKIKNSSAKIIITPHPGEAKRLLDTYANITDVAERRDAACDLAAKFNCITVLKGSGTMIAIKDSKEEGSFKVYENSTGNPGMATAGSGDVLTGVIASLAGQGYSPLEASRLGVFFHGKAGDIAAEEFGEMGMSASDIIDKVPAAIKMYSTITCTVTW